MYDCTQAVKRKLLPCDPKLVDESKESDIIIMTTVFTVLIILSTGGRILTKFCCHVKLRIEDYLILLALVCFPIHPAPIGAFIILKLLRFLGLQPGL